MQSFSGVTVDLDGNVRSGLPVSVADHFTLGAATLFSGPKSGALANPFNSGADGSYLFYAPNGAYDISVTATGQNGPGTLTIANQTLFDPTDGPGGAAGSAAITFTPAGTGGVATDLQTRERKTVFLSSYSSQANFDLAKLALSKTEKMGMGGELQINSHVPNSTTNVLRFINNDPTHGDFVFCVNSGTTGADMDTNWSWGLNADGAVAGKVQWFDTIESDYNNGGNHLAERHLQGKYPNGTNFRCWTWGLDLVTNLLTHLIQADNINFNNGAGTYGALTFAISAASADLIVRTGASFRKSTNNEAWLVQSNAAANNSIEIARIDASNRVNIGPGSISIIDAAGNARLQFFDSTIELSPNGSGVLSLRNQTSPTVASEFRVFGHTTNAFYASMKHNGTDALFDTNSGKLRLGASATDILWGKALVALGGGAGATLGTIGGSGPATAAQNTWMRVLDSTGAAFWVPAWK